MTEIASRHAGTLDGHIEPLGKRTTSVGIELQPAAANRRAVQLTAWMLINLLSRMHGVVSEVIVGVADVPLRPFVIPFARGTHGLAAAAVSAAAFVEAVPVRAGNPAAADVLLSVGPGDVPSRDWRVHGEGFCGAISRDAIPAVSHSDLPFGPFTAACLAVGEIFRLTRLPEEGYTATRGVSYSLWDYTAGSGDLHAVGPALLPRRVDFGMAGVGAVGCAVIHTLWACQELSGDAIIADDDVDGVDLTNLNRCVIFHRRHRGARKASTAAAVAAGSGVRWHPVDDRYTRANLPRIPDMLVSAVDTNSSRNELQQGFWPSRLLAASTHNLRAEVTRFGPPGTGPCLRCHNPPEADVPDDVRREQLRDMTPNELDAFAQVIRQPAELVRRWASEGGCGSVADAALAGLRSRDEPAAMLFSVGFVSVLAGVMLAAEIVKEHGDRHTPLSDELQGAKFQFLRPASAGNGQARPQRRDPNCPACAPDGYGATVWARRYDRW